MDYVSQIRNKPCTLSESDKQEIQKLYEDIRIEMATKNIVVLPFGALNNESSKPC